MQTTFTTNNKPVRALIIEDVKVNAAVLQHTLDQFGVTHYWAQTPDVAKVTLEEKQFDIVFLDHYLNTGSDSGELLNFIKTNYPNVPVISYTAAIYTLGNIKSFLKLFQYDDIVTKPFDPLHVERIFKQRFQIHERN